MEKMFASAPHTNISVCMSADQHHNCCLNKQSVHQKTLQSVCSLLSGSLLQERDVAVEFFPNVHLCLFELHTWSSISFHCIGEKNYTPLQLTPLLTTIKIMDKMMVCVAKFSCHAASRWCIIIIAGQNVGDKLSRCAQCRRPFRRHSARRCFQKKV